VTQHDRRVEEDGAKVDARNVHACHQSRRPAGANIATPRTKPPAAGQRARGPQRGRTRARRGQADQETEYPLHEEALSTRLVG
jgi:hypothetical protein